MPGNSAITPLNRILLIFLAVLAQTSHLKIMDGPIYLAKDAKVSYLISWEK